MGPKGAALLERQRDDPPLSELEFPGCYLRPMTFAEYEDHEGRVEFFDSCAGIACLASEAAHLPHETPLHMLGRLLERIAQMRGSPIVCCGQTEIRRTFGIPVRRAISSRTRWCFLTRLGWTGWLRRI